jgi:hypothetical protein
MSENIPKTADEFDRRFDEGEDIFSLGMDPSKGTRPGLEQRPIDVKLPSYLLNRIDRQAEILATIIKFQLRYEKRHRIYLPKGRIRPQPNLISGLARAIQIHSHRLDASASCVRHGEYDPPGANHRGIKQAHSIY